MYHSYVKKLHLHCRTTSTTILSYICHGFCNFPFCFSCWQNCCKFMSSCSATLYVFLLSLCICAFGQLFCSIKSCMPRLLVHFPCSHVFILYTSIDKCQDIWLGHCMEKHNPWFCYCSCWVWGTEWTSLAYTWQHIRPGEWFLQNQLVSEVKFIFLSPCYTFFFVLSGVSSY